MIIRAHGLLNVAIQAGDIQKMSFHPASLANTQHPPTSRGQSVSGCFSWVSFLVCPKWALGSKAQRAEAATCQCLSRMVSALPQKNAQVPYSTIANYHLRKKFAFREYATLNSLGGKKTLYCLPTLWEVKRCSLVCHT